MDMQIFILFSCEVDGELDLITATPSERTAIDIAEEYFDKHSRRIEKVLIKCGDAGYCNFENYAYWDGDLNYY